MERGEVLCAFAHAVRNNEGGRTALPSLRSSTINATISNVVSTFREHNREDPSRDNTGRKLFSLQRQLRSYKNQDPNTRRQACIPLRIFRFLRENAKSETEIAVAQLVSGALFFVMRSCEYTNTNTESQNNDRKTKIIQLQKNKFFNDTTLIPHSHPNLGTKASTVQITFEQQKNGCRFESVAMHRNSSDLCPVRIWTDIVQRISKYPRGNENSPVNLLRIGRSYKLIESTLVRNTLRSAVLAIGETVLGITVDSVGTHSVRSTFAMLLLIHKVDITTIMKLGRWRSDSVICYIRSNVTDFGKGASSAFVSQSVNSFFNLPALFDSLKNHNSQVIRSRHEIERGFPRNL